MPGTGPAGIGAVIPGAMESAGAAVLVGATGMVDVPLAAAGIVVADIVVGMAEAVAPSMAAAVIVAGISAVIAAAVGLVEVTAAAVVTAGVIELIFSQTTLIGTVQNRPCAVLPL
jgi:hypothetical protein